MADALSKRDIDMIFRAETDGATRSIGELKKTVGDLRAELGRQIAAAERGEVSLDKLAATTRELKQAQDELGTARGLLTNLNTLVNTEEKAAAKTAKLREELQALQAQATAAERPTKSLQSAIERKTRAIDAAEARERELAQSIADQRQQIEQIIGPVSNFTEAFRTIARASKDVSQGLAISGQAAEDFQQRLAAAAAAGKESDLFGALAAKSPLLQSQIDYISQFENRVEMLRQEEAQLERERALAAAQEAQRKAKQRADLNEVLQGNQQLEAQFEALVAEQQRLDSVNAYRKIAAEAKAALTDVTRFDAAAEDTTVSVRRLAESVFQLTQPAAAAAASLETVEKGIDDALAKLENGRGLRVSEYSDSLNQVEQAIAGLQRQAAQVDGLRAQQAAVDRSQAEFEQLRQKALQLAQAMATADEPTAEMARELAQAQRAADAAGAAFQREQQKLRQLGDAAKRAGIDINNLEAAEKKITATAERAANAQGQLQAKLGGGGQGTGIFGRLNAYEMQNLSFQINDVFTQLGSGTPILQVIAQQGGQIAQIFPGAIGAIAGFIPVILAVSAILIPLILAMNQAADAAQRLKQINAAIEQTGTAGRYSAAGVEESIQTLRRLGVAADEARDSVLLLVREGFDPAVFDDFTTAATNMATVTGETVPEATQKLVDAFTGGKDAVLALDNEFQFLSDSTRAQIEATDDATLSTELASQAFDEFYNRSQDVADVLAGETTDASRALENAWYDLLSALGVDDPYRSIISWWNDVKVGAAATIRFLTGLIREYAGSVGRLATAYVTGGVLGLIRASASGNLTGPTRGIGQIWADARDATVQDLLSSPTRRGRTSEGDPSRGTRGRGRTSRADGRRDAAAAARDARRAASEAERERRRAEAEARRTAEALANQQESLTTALDRMTAQALRASNGTIAEQMENARVAVDREYARLFRQLDEFRSEFGADATIGGMTQDQYRAALERNKVLLTQQAQMGVYEENINRLQEERTRRLAEIEDRQNAGLITAQQALREAAEVTSQLDPQMASLVAQARTFATALGGATPSPEIAAFLARLDSIDTRNTAAQTDVRRAALGNLQQMEGDLNRIIEQRTNLLAANNQLVELGLMSQADAQAAAAQAFATTRPLILEQIELQRAFLADLRARGFINQQVYDAELAKLQAIAVQAEYTDQRVLQINQAAQQAFTGGFTSMFNALAQGFANILTGGGDVVDLLEDLGSAALSFAADFLKAIADVIVQMLALQAVRSILGAGSGGIGGLFFHSGGEVGNYGQGTRRRAGLSVSPAVLDYVPRYHNGTQGAGLKNNEMLAVLERGEKVLTEEQQRKEAQRASSGTASKGLRQVLAFGDDQIAGAMAGPAGEEVTVTHIRRNRSRIRQELGLD